MIKTAVILAAGLGSRLRPYTEKYPKGFLRIYDDTDSLIEMSIKALIDNGIDHIYIGTGYRGEYFNQLTKKWDKVTCIHNKNFKNTGSLATLIEIYPFIKNQDIILLESDILYDPSGIRELIHHRNSNVILASNPTNSNDEVFIEIDSKNNLLQLSKDPSKLQSIYGELVGISKLSKELLQKINTFYTQNIKSNKKLDYEDALVALHEEGIFIHKIPNYTWCEIDNEDHLTFARQTIFPRLNLLKGEPQRNILLNPGPATTTTAVKYAQVQPDICPREQVFGDLMQFISRSLTEFVGSTDSYTTILFPGSGTAAVEAILSSVIDENEQLLIISNGAYGQRMQEICDVYHINYIVFESSFISPLDYNALQRIILEHIDTLTHLAIVHNETTTGLLNNLHIVGELCRKYNLTFIVDAMSSYAAIPISMKEQNISYLAASSNKNIQGMAGIGFVIANIATLEKTKSIPAKSYYLNLFAQYDYFNKTHQSRFTPPVQTMYALRQAIIETQNEGINNRYARYTKSWEVLIEGLQKLNLEIVVPIECHSKIITAIYEPSHPNYNFNQMHDELYQKGFTIYPGKVGNLDTFRIANIGNINENDMKHFLQALNDYFKKINS